MLCYLIKSQVRPQQGRDECNCFTVQFFLRDFLDEKAVKNPTHPLLKVFVNPFTMVPQSQLIICYIGM